MDTITCRPGRFDRKIEVQLPDLDGRKKSFQFILSQSHFPDKVDLGYWASRTAGFSGADLANLMNESAIHCVGINQNTLTTFI